LTAAPPSAPTAAPPSAPMPASSATSTYLSLPCFGTPPAELAACLLHAAMSSFEGRAGGVGAVGAGVWATAPGAGRVTTAVGAADGDSTFASWVGDSVRLATTRPVTTADTTATTRPIAVSFQMFAWLDSFMGSLLPTHPSSSYRASDSWHDFARAL